MAPYSNPLIKEESDLLDFINTITRKVVSSYVSRSVIPLREKEDVEMIILEKFLKKKERIINAFEGKSKITTYYTAVINRMCCEVIRKEQKHWYSVNEGENDYQLDTLTTHNIESNKEIHIKDEVKRLANTMLFFNGDHAKVNLYLKYYFDIPLEDEDIEQYCSKEFLNLKQILKDRDSLSKAEVFNNLSKTLNIAENKNVGGDAVRMWLYKKIDTILKRLNGNGQYFYNKESLAILLEIHNQNYNNLVNNRANRDSKSSEILT